MQEDGFLRVMREQPDDNLLRLVFADWLEEQGDPRSELLRLTQLLTATTDCPDRFVYEGRLRALLAAGVTPVGPGFTNSLGMRFAWIPPGTFLMGSPAQEPGRQEDEVVHKVTLTRGYFMGVSPVTQAEWLAVVGNNPSCFQGNDRPVECVSWEDCQEFCRKLAQRDSIDTGFPSSYRLLTEAEWEYACRAGTSSPFYFGDTISPNVAKFHVNYLRKNLPGSEYRQETTPVGSFPVNAWGVGDTHGNVFEWCLDGYMPYTEGPVIDPSEEANTDVRVLRGGSWHSLIPRCRSACRAWAAPRYRGSDVGCRICVHLDHEFVI